MRALNRLLISLAKLADLHVVDRLAHRYQPQGITIVMILKESHLVLHTWPEHRLVVLELLSCLGHIPVGSMADIMGRGLGSSRSKTTLTTITT